MEQTLRDELDALKRRVLALETQGIPLPDGGLATLIGRIESLEAKVQRLTEVQGIGYPSPRQGQRGVL